MGVVFNCWKNHEKSTLWKMKQVDDSILFNSVNRRTAKAKVCLSGSARSYGG